MAASVSEDAMARTPAGTPRSIALPRWSGANPDRAPANVGHDPQRSMTAPSASDSTHPASNVNDVNTRPGGVHAHGTRRASTA